MNSKMEDFAKPENYQGSNLLTIKNIAEKIRLENGKGNASVDIRKKEATKDIISNKALGKMPRDGLRKSLSNINKDPKTKKKDISNPMKRSDYTKLIQRSSKRISSKRESLLIDIDLLKLSELTAVSEQSVTTRKTVPTTRILFGLVYSKRTEEEIKLLAMRQFKRAGRMVLIWMDYFNIITAKSQHKYQKRISAMKFYKEVDESKQNSDLHFDKHHFRVTKEIDLSSDMKKTLTIPPKERTEEQINCVMYGLAALEAFNEYPVHLKKKLCNVAYYKKVDPHRVIIRQGHRAEYFYFIISGTAIVTITDYDRGLERTVNSLTKGCSFGELALLHHSKRTASVVSTSFMQLLAIERTDFFYIFMHIKAELSNYPEHVAFLKEIPIFYHLNAEEIIKYSECCLTSFYKKNSVICTDDRASEWVYVVKSGNCTVVKEIKVPVKGNSFGGNNVSLKDIESNIQCYDNYFFVPTPLNDAAGKSESKTQYLWKSETTFKPGDYFYLKKNITEDNEIEIHSTTETSTNSSRNHMSVFIEVAHMATRDFYGLSSVVFAEEDKLRMDDMASVALISNRAEMVLISKKYLSQNSSDELIKDIRQGISQYPSEEVFLETYQTRMNWDKYRIRNYQSTVKNMVV